MDILNNLINQHQYIWVPIVALVAITLIAGLIGFWNGWKTSLYFFGWNLVGTIVGVFVTAPIMKALDSIGILKVLSSSAEAMWAMLILFVFMIGINFIAFLFYWIFRSKLKKSMKLNKKANKSNLSSRFIGMGIAITSASPAAFFLADATAVMSEENGFTKFTDAVARAYTGGKYDGTSEDRILAGNIDTIKDLADIFSGNGDKDKLKDPETIQKVKDVLNTDLSKNIDSIYDGIKDSGVGGINKNADLSKVSPTDITDNVPAMKIDLSDSKKKELLASVTNLFKNNGNEANAAAIAAALVKQLTDPSAITKP